MASTGQKPNASLSSDEDAYDRAYAAMIARAEALIPKLLGRAAAASAA
jgi:hypothetical protein